MNKTKFISFLLAVVMILSTFTPTLANGNQSGAVPDNGKELKVTTARDEKGIKKNVITLGKRENTERKRGFGLFSFMSTQSGTRAAQEIWDAEVNVKITKFGIGGNSFDWDEVFGKGETFQVQPFYYDENDQRVNVGNSITVNKGDKSLKFTVRLPKTANSINIETDFIDKLGIKAFETGGSGTASTTGKYDIEFELHQIYNPFVNVMWINPYGTKVRGASNAKASFGDAEFNIVDSNSQINLRNEDILVKGPDGEPDEFIDVKI